MVCPSGAVKTIATADEAPHGNQSGLPTSAPQTTGQWYVCTLCAEPSTDDVHPAILCTPSPWKSYSEPSKPM